MTVDLDRLLHFGVKKGKVLPYSLPSVGPGADPGVQAVSSSELSLVTIIDSDRTFFCLKLRGDYRCMPSIIVVIISLVLSAGGLDFYYQQQQDARKLVEFLQSVVPCRYV